MTRNVNLFERLRVENAVWLLDGRLYDLPRQSRIARRRELRANLLEAASDVGAGEAIRRLGNGQQLAAEYLDAELGDAPRARWWLATAVMLAVPLFFTSFATDAALAYGEGLRDANPAATGTFVGHGIAFFQSPITYRLVDGEGSHVGGGMTPLFIVALVVAGVIAGRLWRAPINWWRLRNVPIVGQTRDP